MNRRVARLGELVQEHLDDISALFRPGAKVTLIVRHPGYPKRDFVITGDDWEGVAEVVERSKRREAE